MELCKKKRALLTFLGKEYQEKVIDMEPCVYRDLGDFDIEISGGFYGQPFSIYVWQKRPHMEIIERYKHVNSGFEDIEVLLNDIALRYKCRAAV